MFSACIQVYTKHRLQLEIKHLVQRKAPQRKWPENLLLLWLWKYWWIGSPQKVCCFINALANGLVVIIFFFLYTQNPVLKLCLLAVSFTFSRFMKKYNPCQVGTPRAVPIFQKKVVLLLSQYECFCFWHANWQKPTFRGQKIPLLSQLMWLSLVDIVWITKLRIICVHVGSREYPYTHHV